MKAEKEYIIGVKVTKHQIKDAKKMILDNDHLFVGISFIFEDKQL